MAAPSGDVDQGHGCAPAESRDGLLRLPLPLPRLRTRPWWFPVQELRDPLVFYLEAWLADAIFAEKMKQLEEFLKARASSLQTPQHAVA